MLAYVLAGSWLARLLLACRLAGLLGGWLTRMLTRRLASLSARLLARCGACWRRALLVGWRAALLDMDTSWLF